MICCTAFETRLLAALASMAVLLAVLLGACRCHERAQKFQNKKEVKAIRDAIKKDLPDFIWDDMGYPDMGNGKLGQLLSPGDWARINNAQRAHYNTLESLPLALTLVLTAGVFQPEIAAIAGLIYCVGRWMVSSGYNSKGPLGRYPGGPISLVPLVVLLGINLYSGTAAGLASLGIQFF
jgi:glutathione S-transferase